MDIQSLEAVVRDHPNKDRRCEALHELVSRYGICPNVVGLLRGRAQSDDYWRARAIALQLLADISDKGASLCDLVTECVVRDTDSRVRSTAVEILPRIWSKTVADLRNTLFEFAWSSPYADVRQTALLSACEQFRNDNAVRELLHRQAEADSDPIVRLVAVESLVRDWRDDPAIFSFLCERAMKDIDADVRRAAGGVTLPKVRVFVSYSHRDAVYAKLIIEYLSGELKRDAIELWWDEGILTGNLWDNEIKTRIRESQIALALISQGFLNSNYCQKVEIRNFLRQRRSEGLVIFPLILSACAWKDYDWLSETQALPTNDRNLKSHYKAVGMREELFYRVLIHLQQVARELRRDRN
jgi:hypothetical protein